MPESQYPRVLFVLKHRDNGYGYPEHQENANWGDAKDPKRPLSSGLFNSARLVAEMLEKYGVPVKLVHVIDNNFIHRELVQFKADIVVIEAFWVVPPKFDELLRVCPNVKFIVRNHSESPFLANEGIAYDWMLRYLQKPNVFMSCNAPRMLQETRFLGKLANPSWTSHEVTRKVPFLPNYYPAQCPVDKLIDRRSDTIDIGCFGAVRPLKNHMVQAIAALKFASQLKKRLRFHINGGRLEMGGSPILKNLFQLFSHFPEYELVNHAWKDHVEFKRTVASMDIVTQVSFSETFNIVAADAVTSGVATITSDEVPWSSSLFQADPTSSEDIVRMMRRAYRLKIKLPCFNPSLQGLSRYNEASTREWLSLLVSLKN